MPFCAVSLGTAPVFSDSEGNPITEAVRSVVENTAAGENVDAVGPGVAIEPSTSPGLQDRGLFYQCRRTGGTLTLNQLAVAVGIPAQASNLSPYPDSKCVMAGFSGF